MTAERQPQDGDPVVAAIERVLRAERDGEQQLRTFRDRAQRVVEAARHEAAAIARRADARIARLHANHPQKVQERIARLAPPAGPSSQEARHDQTALQDAARRIAARLTGDP